ncbi:hypothetical protein [Rhizobium wenxiniae]|uniref:hypothetical protein n=1 Tax=Rhizobium wenxiniae TaxID=1737357 RepID=UPI003C2444CD
MLLGRHFHLWRQHLSDPVLLRFYLIGTMLTNVFITVFNYSTFRLADGDQRDFPELCARYRLVLIRREDGGPVRAADGFGSMADGLRLPG